MGTGVCRGCVLAIAGKGTTASVVRTVGLLVQYVHGMHARLCTLRHGVRTVFVRVPCLHLLLARWLACACSAKYRKRCGTSTTRAYAPGYALAPSVSTCSKCVGAVATIMGVVRWRHGARVLVRRMQTGGRRGRRWLLVCPGWADSALELSWACIQVARMDTCQLERH